MMKRMKRFAAILLTLVFLTALAVSASAETQTGTITGNAVNLRSGPALSYSRVQYLYKGEEVSVQGESNGWYAVTTAGGNSGYVYGAYVSLSASTSSTTSAGVLQYGSRGSAVTELQTDLSLLGYLNDTIDGIYGGKTRTAVTLYQRVNGLTADGVAGSKTLTAVETEANRVEYVLEVAKRYLGLAYTYGGTSPSTGFDCSGFTQYVMAQAGISIPRVSNEQAKAGKSVSYSDLRAGDLVFFNSPVSHVGIYLGNGKFIHSPKTGDVVKITDLKYMNFNCARRVTGNVW